MQIYLNIDCYYEIGKHLNYIPSSNSQFSLNPGFQISLTHCTNSSDSQQHRLLMPVESSASVSTKHRSTQLMPKPRPPPIHSIVDTVHSKATINTTPPPKTTTKPPLIHSRTESDAFWILHFSSPLERPLLQLPHSGQEKKQLPTHGSTITITIPFIIILITILLLQCQGGKAIGEFQTPETPNDSRLPRM